jgi:hypothetical protein
VRRKVGSLALAVLCTAAACRDAPCEEARPLQRALAGGIPPPAFVELARVSIPATGVPECDDYIAKFRRCIDARAPTEMRARMLDGLAGSATAWRDLEHGRELLPVTCNIAAAGGRAAATRMGCDWADAPDS